MALSFIGGDFREFREFRGYRDYIE